MLRILCLIGCLALPIGLSLAGASSAAAEESLDPRQVCVGDAMRLCSEFIPDEQKITRCMIAKYRQVSLLCRRAMSHGHARRGYAMHRRHRIHRHHSRRRVACIHGKGCG
jgi:hypothetical protein